MADFKTAYAPTKKSEGGYANVPGDNGGRTYAGIAEKFFPHLPMWAKINSMHLAHNQVVPELAQDVEDFYRAEFWNKIHGDQIVNQKAANQLFDMAVNSGVSPAIKLSQEALGIRQTGVMDEVTLTALNKQAPTA